MRIAFSPSVYEHAARFVGRTPWETSRDAELLFQAHRAAFLEYRHSPIVVGIDIYNLEAEAYGAEPTVPEGTGVPAIHRPLFGSLAEALSIEPFNPAKDGRIPMVLETARRLKREFPKADVRIPVAGPFSIAFNLLGISSLCEYALTDPERVVQLLERLANHQVLFCRAIASAGLDLAFFESAAAPPLLSPRQFRELELPVLKGLIRNIEPIMSHSVPCIMGGDTYRIFDELMSTGTNYVVCNVETNQAAFIAKAKACHPEVKIRVNMDPGIVACHQPEVIYGEIDRILSITAGHPNCLMGTGCLPYETPPENIQLIREYLAR